MIWTQSASLDNVQAPGVSTVRNWLPFRLETEFFNKMSSGSGTMGSSSQETAPSARTPRKAAPQICRKILRMVRSLYSNSTVTFSTRT